MATPLLLCVRPIRLIPRHLPHVPCATSLQGGCVIGGGKFTNQSFDCTNYWYPVANTTACHDSTKATLDCVQQLGEKIPGDDRWAGARMGVRACARLRALALLFVYSPMYFRPANTLSTALRTF